MDCPGAGRLTILGLSAMAAGCVLRAVIPATFGVRGYLAPSVIITLGYALFQTANNTAVMKGCSPRSTGHHFWPAHPVTQSQAYHRRIRNGRSLRARRGDD